MLLVGGWESRASSGVQADVYRFFYDFRENGRCQEVHNDHTTSNDKKPSNGPAKHRAGQVCRQAAWPGRFSVTLR
jgi:hypothetical protein